MFSHSDSGFVLYYGQAEGVEADKKKVEVETKKKLQKFSQLNIR
jgi:hypothetical protein